MHGSSQRTAVTSDRRPPVLAGVLVAVVGVVAVTALLYPLKDVAPAVSLGVVYVVPVLLVSVYWGVWLGVATSLVSALAFNWFHIPPTGRLSVAESSHWVALAALLLVSVVTSTVSDLARARAAEADQRRREADLAASLARDILAGADIETALAVAARRVAEALGLASIAIRLGSSAAPAGRLAIPLGGDEAPLATVLVPADIDPAGRARLEEQIAPTLEALLAIARERDAIQAEAVETAALRRSDDLKTSLLRAVSHDLRTPITAVLAAGHALGSPSLSEEERKELSTAVVEEAERLAGLVDKLLDLSRLEAGKAQPRPQPTSLEEVLVAAATAARKEPGVSFAIDPDLPTVSADGAQLERAFANIIENAARHSDGHPVSVRARATGTRVIVRIVDRGPGIRRADQERIFEPFYRRADSGRPHTGSGLGLAIAKGFIEANGGRISVESLAGQGTSFVVEFPVEASAGVAA